MRGTQLNARCAFFVAARRSNHSGTPRTGQLDGSHTDPAAAALHQEKLTRLQTPPIEDIAPHGEECFRQRSRFDVIEPRRNRQALPDGRDTPLRIPTASHQGADPVAHLQTCRRHGLCVASLNHASNLQARQVRRTRRWSIVPRALQYVRPVDTARRHTNQQLTHTRLGHRPLSEAEHVGRTEGRNLHSTHQAFGHKSQLFKAI